MSSNKIIIWIKSKIVHFTKECKYLIVHEYCIKSQYKTISDYWNPFIIECNEKMETSEA